MTAPARPVTGLTLGLGAVMAAGTFLGFAFGGLAPFLVADLQLSAVAVGLLPSIMYAAGALAADRVGGVVDRVGPARALTAVPVLVGVVAVMLAAAPRYPVVLLAALLAGVPLAATNPTTNRVVSIALPPGSRGAVMGWKQAGVAGGSVIAGSTLPALATAVGWRAALLVTAGACLILALLLRATLTVPASEGDIRPTGEARGETTQLVDLGLFAALMGAANGAVATYLVLFAVTELGFPPARAGLAAALMGAVSVAARVVWAWSADRSGRPVLSLSALSLVAVVGSAVTAAAAATGSAGMLWAAAVLLGASATAWPGLLMLAAVDRATASEVGRVSGRMTRSFYAGYVVGPVVFGFAVDHGPLGFLGAWVGVLVAAGAAGLTLAVGPRGRR